MGYAPVYAGSNLALNFTKMLLFNSTVIFYAQRLLAKISPKSLKSIKFSLVFGIQGVEIFPPRANVHENAGQEKTIYLFLDICCEVKIVTKFFSRCLGPSLFAFNKLTLKGLRNIGKTFILLPSNVCKSSEIKVFPLFLHLL